MIKILKFWCQFPDSKLCFFASKTFLFCVLVPHTSSVVEICFFLQMDVFAFCCNATVNITGTTHRAYYISTSGLFSCSVYISHSTLHITAYAYNLLVYYGLSISYCLRGKLFGQILALASIHVLSYSVVVLSKSHS